MKFPETALIFFILSVFIVGCNEPTVQDNQESIVNIVGTKWGYNKLEDGWCDVYSFYKDSAITSYSCEVNELINGIYYFQHDTLVIEEILDYPEGYLPTPNTCELPIRIKFTLLISGDSMRYVNKYDWINNKYVLTDDTYFADNIVYQLIR